MGIRAKEAEYGEYYMVPADRYASENRPALCLGPNYNGQKVTFVYFTKSKSRLGMSVDPDYTVYKLNRLNPVWY